MRFAKFFFALLFGVVFIITLFKVLFFMLMAGLVVGAIFLAGRAFGHRRHRFQHTWDQQYGSIPQYTPFGRQPSTFDQPLNPNWQRPSATPIPGRRIEVL